MGAVGDREGDAGRPEADPGIEAFREACPLGQGPQRFDHASVEQTEIAGSFRQLGFAEAGEELVEGLGEIALQRALALAVGALAVDVEEALAPFRQEGRDHLRRVLQVGIHDHHGLAIGMVEPGGDRDLLAEIAAERDRADPAVLRIEGSQRRQRSVAAAVVDADDLPGGDLGVENRLQPGDQRREIVGLVVDRHHDRELRPRSEGRHRGGGGSGRDRGQGFRDLHGSARAVDRKSVAGSIYQR